MTIVSVTYVNAAGFNRPEEWVRFIKPYLGVFEELSRHHKIHCVEQINYTGEYEEAGISYHFLNYGKKINRFPFRLHKVIKKLRPDIVFVRGLHFPLQVILLRMSLGKNAKIVAQHHADKPFTGIKKRVQKMADRCINTYLFASADIATEWVEQGVISSRNKIKEIGMISSFFQPTDKDETRKKTGVTGSPVFLWVGNLNPNKDPLTVLKAFCLFLRSSPDAKLYMIFQGNELLNETENLLKEDIQYSKAVVLVGKIDHKELSFWYNSADFFISGSHNESYGAALIEAMSCGCIPVVTDIPSFRMMTANGKCGLLYEPGNEKDLLAALLKAMNISIEKERMKVLQQFNDELSFEAIAGKIGR